MTNAPATTPVAPTQNLLPAGGQPPVNGGAPLTIQQQQQYQAYQQQLRQQQQQPQQQPTYQQPQQPPPSQQPQQSAQAQPPGQPQQAHYFPHQGLNGGWQSDKDVQERRTMIAKIVHLLQQRKPNAPQEWLRKLPQMAKRLEESLYRSAKSFDEYNDSSTLKQRLQQLAVNIGMKTKKMQQQAQLAKEQQQGVQQQQQQQQQQQTQFQPPQEQAQPQAQPPAPPQQQYQPLPQYATQSQHQPIQLQTQPASVPSTLVVHSMAPQSQPQVLQQPQVQTQIQPQAPQRQIVSMSDINPIMSQPQSRAAPVPGAVAPGTTQSAPQGIPMQVQYQQPPAPVDSAPPPTAAAAPVPSLGTGHVSDRQQVLRHQQQRLLLLRHAAKCQHDDGRCPVTPHCAGMKRLWKHIAECKDQKCLVPHCVSSRYVLSHYHRCKDVRCPVCGPVREAIHRSHEKQKQMQALKQRHQQAVEQNQMSGPNGTQAPAPTSSALNQPSQPGFAPTVTPVEPAPKRLKPNSGLPVAAGVPAYVQRQHGATGGQKVAAIPTQPANPNVKPGYVYSRPQVAAPGPAAAKRGVPGLAYSNGQVIMPKHSGPKPQEDHTLINCFTVEQIETHIASLNTGLQLSPQKLKTKCLDLMKVLQSHQHGWVFNSPVDPVELGLPDYFEVVKKPMDLGTIKKKLENGCYHSIVEFESHVNLTFDNAMLYNPEGSVVYNMAKEMKDKFAVDYAQLIKQLNIEEEEKRKNGEACLLCGCEKLLFEPPIFYCNGMNCPAKRIRRNSYYYVAGNNQYHWCHQCFGELRDNQILELGDMTVKKEHMAKKKNDENHEESWVQCDKCERWIHQICALFNTRQNKDQRSEFTCPRCTVEERKKKGTTEGTSTTPMAEDLPRTKLSQRLETHVRKKVDEYFAKCAKEKAELGGIPIEEAKEGLHMGGAITIRQVTSMDRKLEVRERMKRRYAFKNYPEEFTFRCKCIIVFQNLDGVDAILFGLYVYEHDETNPGPNTRTVYVSYLDSVHYMRPRNMRTLIYHEILIAYLDYVRAKGFSTAHIWACPPLKGDDYILYAKPEDQKTPRDDRLRQWYVDMLLECQKRGIVGKLTNMYDLYFADEKNDATVVPYMDGDYFPAEAENIIKQIEEGKSGKKASSAGKKKTQAKAKSKKKSGRGGTRSTGLDEDALAASGIFPLGMQQKTLEDGGRDYVMAKLGDTIQPMKESFIVAYLAWKGAKPEDMIVSKDIQEYRDEHGIVSRHLLKDTKEEDGSETANDTDTKGEDGSKNANDTDAKESETMESPEQAAASSNSDPDKKATEPSRGEATTAAATVADASQTTEEIQNALSTTDTPSAAPLSIGDTTEAAPEDVAAEAKEPVGDGAKDGEEKKDDVKPAPHREGKFAAMAARKRDLEGNVKEKEPVEAAKKPPDEETKEEASESSSKRETVRDANGRLVQVIDDDKEEMDCEFLNNRQAFLNLCQGNHYQFDSLRRCKHSSMMVLWHLHNRDAPKFVQQCAICSREILAGYRYHCPICADYDQCHDCVSNPNTPRHPHQLKPIAVASGQQNELTEAQRKERQRSIQLHMTLLLHAATCSSSTCPSANCTKMKGLLKHGAQCQVKATGGCHVCKRIWALLQLHARQCQATACPVPNCMAIRERFRQLKKQQQAMDDRRRQEMNRHYQRGI